MRCPKCGYNSFDHLDSCKKCGKDLAEHKQKFGIVSVLFPGEMKPVDQAADGDESLVDDAVAAATAPAAAATAAAAAGEATAGESTAKQSSEGDDFGFDFMGDSEEEEDLSFDELFEEAPADEDVEETLPSPDKEDSSAAEGGGEFSFDTSEEDEIAETSELDDDFGFDLGDEEEATPPAEEDGLSFDPDNVDFADEDEDAGTEGDPKNPFDLPGSSPVEEAPEESLNFAAAGLTAASAEEDEVPLDYYDDDSLTLQGEAALSNAESVATISPAEAGVDGGSAGLLPTTGHRVAAFCCDLLLLMAVAISFIVAAEAAISTSSDSLFPSLETLIDLSVPYFLVLFSLAFGYFTLFHFLAGQTPGKMLAGLRVETVAGEPLLFSQAFLRSVGGLLQALPAGLGYLVILTSTDRRGWNDRLAGTRLISLKGCPEEV